MPSCWAHVRKHLVSCILRHICNQLSGTHSCTAHECMHMIMHGRTIYFKQRCVARCNADTLKRNAFDHLFYPLCSTLLRRSASWTSTSGRSGSPRLQCSGHSSWYSCFRFHVFQCSDTNLAMHTLPSFIDHRQGSDHGHGTCQQHA